MQTDEQKVISRFIELRNLEDISFTMLCSTFGIAITNKDEAIRTIIRLEKTPQLWTLPQAIAIKTKDSEGAKEFVHQANLFILPQDNNGKVIRERMKKREFSFATRDGKIYKLDCPYAPLKKATLDKLVTSDWLEALEGQKVLIEKLKSNPEMFTCNLIRKQDKKKRFYLMIHVEKKG